MNTIILSLVLLLLPNPQDDLPGSWLGRFKLAEEALEDGAIDEAIELLNSCFELAPTNATTAYHLACAYARTGRLDEALYWLEKAVDWGWIDAGVIRWDIDLAPLRSNNAFDEIAFRARKQPGSQETEARLMGYFNCDWPSCSPDGERLVDNGYLWDVRTEERLAILSHDGYEVDDSYFDPLENYIVTTGNTGIRILDGRNGRLLKELGDLNSCREIIFTKDGSSFFTNGRKARRFALPNGVPEAVYGLSTNGLAVSSDGGRVLTVSSKTPTLWDGQTGEEIDRISLIGDSPIYVGFSLNGSYAYICSSLESHHIEDQLMERIDGIHWIDGSDGTVLRSWKYKARGFLTKCVFNEEGFLITYNTDGWVRWWSHDQDTPVREWRVPGGGRENVDLDGKFGPYGERLVTYTYDGPCRLWNVSNKEMLREWPSKYGHARKIFTHAGLLVQLRYGSSVEIVDPFNGQTREHLDSSALTIDWPQVLLDDITAITPSEDGTLRAFNLETGRLRWILDGHTARISGVDLHPNGVIAATASKDGTARIWDLKYQREIALLDDAFLPGSYWERVKLHPDGTRVATSASQSPTRVWSAKTGSLLYELPLHEYTHNLAWSPDGSYLGTAHRDGTARLWDASTGAPIGLPMNHQGDVYYIAFNREGHHVATGAEGPTLRVWAVPTGELIAEPTLSGNFLFGGEVQYLTWLSNGNLLATTSAWPTIECFDGHSFAQRWFFEEYGGGNHAPLYAIQNARCTRLYVTGMVPSHSRVFDPETGVMLANLGEEGYWDLSGTSDDRLVIANRGGTVVLDGDTYDERYHRIEFAEGGALLYTPAQIYHGSTKAIRDTYLYYDKEPIPLDCFAPILYDPKRFLAAAAGVSLRRPNIPITPRLLSDNQDVRKVAVTGDEATVTVQAESLDGIIGFQLERDGEVMPLNLAGTTVSIHGQRATLNWTLNRPASRESKTRVRVIGRSGALSKPALLSLKWQ